MPTIALLGTLDTKGPEHEFVAQLIRARGHRTILIDVGTKDPPRAQPDYSREQVAAAGGLDLASILARGDRGEAVAAMSAAAPKFILRLCAERRIDGLISLGGGGGTAIGTAAMRALPIGFPKLMVSTLAAGNTAAYLGPKDIVMFPSIVDIAGLNRISRTLLARAAGAICGMVETAIPASSDRPVVVASQFGNTTRCVDRAREILDRAGFEVLVFHATGAGGRTMESLIETGAVSGVLDITTTEWADELVGGVLSAGPTRLEAAARHGVPAVIAPGCLDMVNFGPPETVPQIFQQRRLYHHNPQVTLMRTTPAECRDLGRIIAAKLNGSTGPVSVFLPLRGISAISAAGQPFHDAAADQALFSSLQENLRADIPVRELDCNINDPEFAQACAGELRRLLRKPDMRASPSPGGEGRGEGAQESG